MSKSDRIIYIMGRGHSGSTILAGLLGHAPDVEGVGELIYPMNKSCGCGRSFADCSFWQKVRSDFEHESDLPWDQSIRLIQEQANILQFPKTWFAVRNSSRVQELGAINQQIVRSVLRVAEKHYLVDASKQPTRALFLMRCAPQARFVHVVRSPEGYFRSYFSRIKAGRVNFLRREYRSGPLDFLMLTLVAVSWVIANVQCELVRLLAPSRVLRVRFEDLTRNPEQELQRLAPFVELDLCPVIEAVRQGQRMKVGHIIGGNDNMRSSDGFRLEHKKSEQAPLPWHYRTTVRLISWPLMLAYRYPLS